VYTSTPTFTSPSKDQHSNGLHVIEAKNIEKVGQPSMHMDLETLGLKQLQTTTTNCNIAFVGKMQLHSNKTSCPHDASSWKLVTTSNFTFVDLIKKIPSKQLRLFKVKHKDALVSAHIELKHVVTMN
jgi:hypothetical protein